MTLFTRIQIALAVFFLVVGGSIWLVLLRPVPKLTARGLVTRKTHKPAGEYWQYQSGSRAGFHGPTKITLAEGFILEIESSELPGPLFAAINVVEARQFEVGDAVAIEYVERSIPLLWRRIYISQVSKQ